MKYLSSIIPIALLMASCNQSESQVDILQAWDTSNIHEITSLELSSSYGDLQGFGEIVDDAQLVCLGESRHDLHEQFKLKLRLIKFLVEEKNFTTLALEASLPYSTRINTYLMTGEGNLDEIMANMPGWFLWDTQELYELFSWLKDYNTKSANKVRFYGFDIVAPSGALTQIMDFLEQRDQELHEAIGTLDYGNDLIDDNNWPSTVERYSGISEERRVNLAENYTLLSNAIKENEELYRDLTSQEEYDWIRILAYSALKANQMFSTRNRLQMGLIRDEAMADIASWIKRKNDNTVIWAHNVHITKAEFTMSMFPDSRIKGMGAWLHEEFADEMVSIGASFGRGQFVEEGRVFELPAQGHVGTVMASARLKNYLLDIRQKTEDLAMQQWLNSEQILRGQEFEMHCTPIDAFDALFFTDEVSRVRYNAQTALRLNR